MSFIRFEEERIVRDGGGGATYKHRMRGESPRKRL